jgi:hypothetical protein
MEPAAAPLLCTREPAAPPETAQLGLLGWPSVVPFVAGCLAYVLYCARYDAQDMLVRDYFITYLGLWMLYMCLRRHEQLRGGDDDPAAAAELRRVRLVPLAISLYLGSLMALRVTRATPSLAPAIGLWVLLVLAVALGLYFTVAASRSGTRADDAGRCWPEEVPHDREMSPEQTV